MILGPDTPPRRRALSDKTTLYEVTLEEGRRALGDQSTHRESITQRIVQYLAFLGATGAFLVGTAMKGTLGPRPITFLLLSGVCALAFLICLLLTWSILTTSKQWWWPISSSGLPWINTILPRILHSWIHPEMGAKPNEADFLQALADQYESLIHHNERSLAVIRRRYCWFLGIGFVQLFTCLILIGWFG